MDTALDAAVEAGIGPLGGVANVSVPHRIVMDIVGMTPKIQLITDEALPEPPLPDATPPFLRRRAESLSPGGIRAEKRAFMSCQREEKSASPGGNVQMQCR